MGSSPIASASSGTSEALSSRVRTLRAPGRTSSRSVPIASMRESTCALLPSPSASMAITAPTPMMMPSSVSTVRNRLVRSERSAIFTASITSGSRRVCAAGSAARGKPAKGRKAAD